MALSMLSAAVTFRCGNSHCSRNSFDLFGSNIVLIVNQKKTLKNFGKNTKYFFIAPVFFSLAKTSRARAECGHWRGLPITFGNKRINLVAYASCHPLRGRHFTTQLLNCRFVCCRWGKLRCTSFCLEIMLRGKLNVLLCFTPFGAAFNHIN